MRLTVVGCSGSVPSVDSPASCYLVEADDGQRPWRVLLDLGSGALGPLQQHVDPTRLDAVLLSHLHADHCLDLCGLYVMLKYAPQAGTPEPHRVRDPVRGDVQGPQLDRLPVAPLGEVQLSVHAGPGGQVVRASHALGRAVRPPDCGLAHPARFRRPGSWRVLEHDVEAAEVKAVVGVQVREQDRVEARRVDVLLQRAQSTVAQVEQDSPGAPSVIGLDEVAGGSGVGRRHAA
jgi:hypothetical protein